MSLLSRAAENIYWMARYLERAEDTAKLIEVNAQLLLDLPREQSPGWGPLITILGMDASFFERFPEASEQHVIAFLTGDPDNPGSVLYCLRGARENARGTRDIVPRAVWEDINDLYYSAQEALEEVSGRYELFGLLDAVVTRCQKIKGLISGTMTQDEAHDMLMLGRRVERADMTTRVVDVRTANLIKLDVEASQPCDELLWANILKSLSGDQMYKRWNPRIKASAVLRFLIQNADFPRSVAHCLADAKTRIEALPGNGAPLSRLAELDVKVRTARLDGIGRSALQNLLDELQIGVARLHDAIAATYFAVE
jgi:uncharacterized alpha-E superfamily protein